ncbi:MAG: GH116 family glycosyl-hydrolase [Thermomicrobiales bacterium]|nr:GH116 family glycosyl-hydrolase [Thermomicrobiales bacterium]
MKTYSGEALRAVAMPIGGIGTGNIAVAGDGSLRQWQIHHQINHQATVPHSFFAISIDGPQGRVARVLQSNALYNSPGETPPPTSSDAVVPPAHRELLATLPGVTGTEFCGPYPFANVAYQDEALPLDIRMQAWNPMIPFNANDSGIPAITFTFTVHNPGTSTYTGTLAATQQNTIGWDGIAEISGTRCKLFGGNRNEDASGNGRTAVRMINDFLPAIAAGNGQTMLSTNAYGATTCTDWRDLEEFWPPFANYGHLPDSRNTGPTAKGETCNAAIGVPFTIEPHGTRTISFQIAWYFPNRYINWYQWDTFGVDDPKSQLWVGTHYATVFASVDDVSSYLWKNHDELLTQTRSFSDALTGGNLPEVLIDTVTAQMSIMRSPTCFWADDGNFYGFEGCNGFSTLHHAPGVTGSCPLNCTHVWNYEQSLAHLYPELDRTMRDTEWFLQQHPSGYLPHRVPLPRYVSRIWGRHIGGPDNPALDGLLGAILKTWREFRSTGDLAWLERCWPHVEQNFGVHPRERPRSTGHD